MPTYTYACNTCGAQVDRRQSFSELPLTTCESCGGALRRVLYPVGVIFKGSGFYNTDYKKTGANGSTSADGAAEKSKAPDSKTGETSKSDSKPATESKPSGAGESTTKQAASAAKD